MKNLLSALSKEIECKGYISVSETPKPNQILIVVEAHVQKGSIGGAYSNIVVEKIGNNRKAKTNVYIDIKEHSTDSYINIMREAILIVKDKFISKEDFKKYFE